MNDLMMWLKHLANINGINIVITDELDENDTDISIPAANTIVINENYKTTVDVAFRLAHELAHLIFGSNDQNKVYGFSIFSNKESEKSANRNALKIITKFLYKDVPLEYRNWVRFMEEFGLPDHLEHMVKEEILNA